MSSQAQNAAFEIIGIGMVSDKCSGTWKEKADCTDKKANQFIMANIDWESIDSLPHGKHRLKVAYDVDDNGVMTNISISSDTKGLGEACSFITNNWPTEFRYIRQDGLKIVGRYATFFSFYF